MSDGRKENKSAGRRRRGRELQGGKKGKICRQVVRWQESGTATQLCFWHRGTPEIGVSVFHCQGVEWGETRDSVMCGETEKDRGFSGKLKKKRHKEKWDH